MIKQGKIRKIRDTSMDGFIECPFCLSYHEVHYGYYPNRCFVCNALFEGYFALSFSETKTQPMIVDRFNLFLSCPFCNERYDYDLIIWEKELLVADEVFFCGKCNAKIYKSGFVTRDKFYEPDQAIDGPF